MINFEDIQKILVINLGGIGDCLLSSPALKALRKHYSGARIVFLGVARTCELAKNFNIFDEVIIFPAYEEKTRSFDMRRLAEVWSLLTRLRRERFDIAVNMRTIVSWPSAIKMAAMFFAIGARLSAGRDTSHRGFFLNVKVAETDKGQKHEMEYDIDTIRAMGVRDINAVFDPSLLGSCDISVLLEKEGVNTSDFLVGVNPGGAFLHRWPLENFKEVMSVLSGRLGCVFAITGGPHEKELAGPLKEVAGARVVDLVGGLDLAQTAALIKRCGLFISNDTGVVHIAAVLKTPLVAIFGPGYLTRFDPRRISENAFVLYKDAPCSPCDKIDCPSLKCLKVIKPEDAVEAVFKLFAQIQERRT